MNRTVSLLSGLVLLLSYPAVGQEAAASREASSQLSGSQLGTLKQQTSQSDLAQEWGLNQQEWTRYQTLMQGPRGVYSPGIDPLTALGIEARSAEERRRYAYRSRPNGAGSRRNSPTSAHTTKPSPAPIQARG